MNPVLPSDSWLAEQLAWAYQYKGVTGVPDSPFPWDYQLPGDTVRGGIKRFPERGFQLVLFPGTEDPHEWLLNVSAWPRSVVDHPLWGKMPWGFADGMEEAGAALVRELDPGLAVLVIAHSRGCPHAVQFVLSAGQRPLRVVLMGCPRPGTVELVRAWQQAEIPAVSYRTVNAHRPSAVDGVTRVPLYIDGLAPFCPVMAWTDLAVVPKADDPWMLLALHHEDTMYLEGIKELERRSAGA